MLLSYRVVGTWTLLLFPIHTKMSFFTPTCNTPQNSEPLNTTVNVPYSKPNKHHTNRYKKKSFVDNPSQKTPSYITYILMRTRPQENDSSKTTTVILQNIYQNLESIHYVSSDKIPKATKIVIFRRRSSNLKLI